MPTPEGGSPVPDAFEFTNSVDPEPHALYGINNPGNTTLRSHANYPDALPFRPASQFYPDTTRSEYHGNQYSRDANFPSSEYIVPDAYGINNPGNTTSREHANHPASPSYSASQFYPDTTHTGHHGEESELSKLENERSKVKKKRVKKVEYKPRNIKGQTEQQRNKAVNQRVYEWRKELKRLKEKQEKKEEDLTSEEEEKLNNLIGQIAEIVQKRKDAKNWEYEYKPVNTSGQTNKQKKGALYQRLCEWRKKLKPLQEKQEKKEEDLTPDEELEFNSLKNNIAKVKQELGRNLENKPPEPKNSSAPQGNKYKETAKEQSMQYDYDSQQYGIDYDLSASQGEEYGEGSYVLDEMNLPFTSEFPSQNIGDLWSQGGINSGSIFEYQTFPPIDPLPTQHNSLMDDSLYPYPPYPEELDFGPYEEI